MKEKIEKVQDPVGILLDMGYTEYKIFHRVNNANHDYGYGIFTGEFGSNCDGITLKFTDGKEFLADFCTLQDSNNPQLMWDITKEIERYSIELSERLMNIKREYLYLN